MPIPNDIESLRYVILYHITKGAYLSCNHISYEIHCMFQVLMKSGNIATTCLNSELS